MTTHPDRTLVLIATGGLALVLLVSPLSAVMVAAVALTMVGVAVTHRLTANPLRVVHVDAEPERRGSPSR